MITSNHFITFFILCLHLFVNAVHAEEADISVPPAPAVEASAYLLQDFHTGKVLAANNQNVKLAPASLTKIMTVYVVLREIAKGHLHLDDVATISQKAWGTSGSRMFLEVNAQVKVEDLLKGVIIQSGNDASVALAEHVAGNELTFADMMNQHATRLGMMNSHFNNSDGLPSPDHYTTAQDLAILTTALIKEFPDYYRWFSQKEFTYNNIVQHNRNKLLSRDESVDGVKTGFTDDAGYCLVASALRENMRLISVVMGAKSANARANENQNLLNYGFRFFESHRLYEAKKTLSDARVWKGNEQALALGVFEDIYVTIPRRHYNDLKAEINIDKKIIAPIEIGQKLGSIIVKIKNDIVVDKELVALTAIEQGNIARRLYDGAMMMLEKSDAGK
ncbi:MAG: D-alanyl-D-alanine carboxypeptidase [Methylovulum sp.]|jgi:D-alanyl-D-alanine carboxypeptidase (penicillin-binding protein 5/6)|nr:D-alanyl-D-alanine carboxypeptidase [Methylovulum sp.]